MTYSIEFKTSAKPQLAKLHKAIALRLQTKIEALAEEPRPLGHRKLKRFENSYRIRVGDYRVIYEIHDDVLLVLVVKVRPRRDIYCTD